MKRMKFKDFMEWCNDRASDGMWGPATVVICTSVIREVLGVPFWRREKKWRELDRQLNVVEGIVIPVNLKIDTYLDLSEGG